MLIDVRDVKKKDRLIEVIATDVGDLAMMGFGSVKNCKSVYNALIEKYTHVKFNIVRTKSDLEKIVYRKPDLVFTGIKYVIFNSPSFFHSYQPFIGIKHLFDLKDSLKSFVNSLNWGNSIT